MRVEVLLFGPAGAAVNSDRVAVEVAECEPGVCTVREALQALQAQHPALRSAIGTIERARLAVNHQYASAETKIRPGDEVALIALVGGG
ncbi:MAG: MoaD/ThiS family protein [Phycisphaerales bacterium]|nr:MoaD/ThiS family protein [Phycisphaerales bacterium]